MLKAYIQLFRLKPIPMIMLMVVFAHTQQKAISNA